MMRGGGAGAVWAQEKPTLQTSMGEILRRLGEVVASQKRHLIYATITIVISSALQMIPPEATRYVIDNLIPTANVRVIIALAIGLIMLNLARFGLLYVSRYAVALAAQHLVYEMAQRLFENVENLP
ncbi:MAG: ABC transporter transmembrane domain-containing protein, partial [Chloroflexi bacterium]|nr:ABC transporter transmembrane domain-containing protein [Chloroflexota bacterium]